MIKFTQHAPSPPIFRIFTGGEATTSRLQRCLPIPKGNHGSPFEQDTFSKKNGTVGSSNGTAEKGEAVEAFVAMAKLVKGNNLTKDVYAGVSPGLSNPLQRRREKPAYKEGNSIAAGPPNSEIRLPQLVTFPQRSAYGTAYLAQPSLLFCGPSAAPSS